MTEPKATILSLFYPYAHWLFSLAVAPFMEQLTDLLFKPSPHRLADMLEIYPLVLIFGVIFSAPAFLLYFLLFSLLSYFKVNPFIAKVVLTGFAAISVMITMTVIGGTMSKDVILAYVPTVVLFGMILRIRKQEVWRLEEKGLSSD